MSNNVIARGDLQFHYDWTAAVEHDNARITGFPDNRELARHEGYEVLPFLNRFCASRRYTATKRGFDRADALKAERMIRIGLPSTLRSQVHVHDWLVANWAQYS